MEEQRIKIGTPASGQHHPAKPMLSIDEQINHLKSKGVTFRLCSEEEAAAYLTDRTYFFKIAAYRVLFQKRVGGTRDGQYIDLDFGYLKSLASLDRNLRYALLPLTLDVEHAARTKLMRIATAQELRRKTRMAIRFQPITLHSLAQANDTEEKERLRCFPAMPSSGTLCESTVI